MGARFIVLLVADSLALLSARLVLGSMFAPRAGGGGAWPAFVAAGPLADPGKPASTVFWIAMFAALLITGAYSRYRALSTTIRITGAIALSALLTTVPLAAVTGLRPAVLLSFAVGLATLPFLLIGRNLAELFLGSVWPRARWAGAALVVGPPDAPQSEIARAVTASGGEYKIAAHCETVASGLGADPRKLSEAAAAKVEASVAEAVIVTENLPERQLSTLVEVSLAHGCVALCPPRALQVEGIRARLVWHHDQPLLEFATPGLQPAALLTKRITDVVGSALLLVLTAPLALIIAAGITLDSPGPVFFTQDRAGLGGRRFRMLKFRTMRTGADEEKHGLAHLNHTGDVRLFKIPADPRVTPFGRFLRRWSLDELPQFWNVLRGDMSLVGPRPFFESDFAAYEDHHYRRLDTKPGITGLWQVSGRSDVVDFEDVVYLDRQYIEQWSFWLDLSILLRTMPSVLRRHGAY